MTLREFHNGLRILHSIDADEFEQAGADPADYAAFSRDPARFLIRCDDATADALWTVIHRRQTRQNRFEGGHRAIAE